MDFQDNFDSEITVYKNNIQTLLDVNAKFKEFIADLISNLDSKTSNIFVSKIKDIINVIKKGINENIKIVKSKRKDIGKLCEYMSSLTKAANIIQQSENKTKIMELGKYKGQLKDDKRDGKGIMYYDNGDRYEGDWKNDKKEGKGIYYYNGGDRYEGDWKNNKYEGKGIYYYNDGDRYEGDWKNDKKDGKGIYYYNDGGREMGDYLNGKQIGKHVKLYKNGKVESQNFNNDNKEDKKKGKKNVIDDSNDDK